MRILLHPSYRDLSDYAFLDNTGYADASVTPLVQRFGRSTLSIPFSFSKHPRCGLLGKAGHFGKRQQPRTPLSRSSGSVDCFRTRRGHTSVSLAARISWVPEVQFTMEQDV